MTRTHSLALCIATFIPFSIAIGDITTDSTRNGEDIVDLSGLEFWGVDGDPRNGSRSFQLTDPGPPIGFGYIILHIQYDLVIESAPGSTFDNFNIRFGNTDGSFHGNWPDSFQPAPGNFSDGLAHFSGSFNTDIHLNDDGLFHVSLFESIDDGLSGLDATLLEGSALKLSLFIPTPASSSVLLLGALTSCARRRRS